MDDRSSVTAAVRSRAALALPLVLVAGLLGIALVGALAFTNQSPATPPIGSNGTPDGVLAAAADPDAPATTGVARDAGWQLGSGALGLGINGRGHGVGRITITAIEGAQLSLRTDNGWTRTIDASGAEVFRGETEIALADLRVGDQIAFREVRAGDGSTQIVRIQVLEPSVVGTITGVADATVTVRLADGSTTTIQTTASTVYRLGRETVARGEALVSGHVLRAVGTRDGDAFTATTVHVAPATIAGEVTAKAGSTITVTDPAGDSRTINVSSETTYFVRGDDSPSLDDIVVGDRIAAQGQLNADGSLDADVVVEGRGPGRGGPGRGGRDHRGFGPFGGGDRGGGAASG